MEGSKKYHEAPGPWGGDFLLSEGNRPGLSANTTGESLADWPLVWLVKKKGDFSPLKSVKAAII